ncbi:MAG: sodium:alanine symporter family protein [Oscillospiraceae bacterium]|nr:sodium:alanine symporter family protein [Oscillospiraceae bacterium]MBR0450565.1 sodium:alanine symporter family protein [Oscillospiraceae bacterium]
MEAIDRINDFVNSIVWGWPTMILLVGTGIFLTICLRGIQFRHLGECIRNTIQKRSGSAGTGAVTPFQAFATALAGTVGTGNIVGCSGAIIAGGPGAVFWLWISGLFGMATKYSEVLLAIRYRKKNEHGERVGGPMFYIEEGLGKKWKWLAVFFAFAGACAAFGIGCLSQVSSVVSAIRMSINAFAPLSAEAEKTVALVVGICTAVVLALVIIGGLKRIGKFAANVSPFMSIIYLIFALVVIIVNIGSIGTVLKSILVGAFTPRAVLGAAIGISMKQAMSSGIGRGLFSNEAGQGSAPIAHAGTEEDVPAKQGMTGVFEVFFDTIVICTITCLAVLMSGVPVEYVTGDKNVLPIIAFSSIFGDKLGSVCVAVSLVLFAFTTMVSWSLYGVRCFEYLLKTDKYSMFYRLLFVLVVAYGATVPLGLAYRISDTLNGLMAIPNIIALLALSKVIIEETKKEFPDDWK